MSAAEDQTAPPAPPTFREATKVWLKIGLLGFGGPAGQIALMHKELVEERRWIGERRFLHALNYCMLLPGPEAQQLAVYIGWLLHRTIGGIVAGILFVLPGALLMLALSVLYAVYRRVPLVEAVFFGVKAAVLAIVIEAVWRIAKRALRHPALVAIAAAAFVALYAFRVPFPLVIVAAAIIGWIASRFRPQIFMPALHASKAGTAETRGSVDAMFERGEMAHTVPSWRRALGVLAIWLPIWLAPVVALLVLTGTSSIWTQLGAFFSAMAVVTFGGAYAVLSYVAQAAVDSYGWLAPGEMLDGLGLAETTPGPLILVLQYVGFLAAHRAPGALDPLAAGSLGALLTTWVTFAPCFLWIFLGAPYVERLRNNRAVAAALSSITAAVVGVVLNLAVWFALHVLFGTVRPMEFLGASPDVPILWTLDWRAALLSALAVVAVFRLKLGMLRTLGASAVAGLVLFQIA